MSLDSDLQGVIDDAATASASLASIVAGSDAVVANFDGLKDLVDSLSAFASTMKSGVFYTPTGSIMPFAGSTAPSDWYLCNGASFASHSLSSGDALYDLLTGAGWSALPDLKGRTIIGVGAGLEGVTGVLKTAQGVANTTLTSSHIPEHNHAGSSVTSTGAVSTGGQSNDHSHYFNDTFTTFSSAGPQLGTGTTYSRFTFGYSDQGDYTGGVNADHSHRYDHGHGLTIANYGSASPTAVSAVQPSLALNYIIKG